MSNIKTYEVRTADSKDGTPIGYRKYGQGPGLILLQGGMGAAENFAELAEILAGSFTVYVPDRRGRGMTPFEGEYTLSNDIDDLAAIVNTTGAHNVFGLSTGGLILLKAALTLINIEKIAIYEPALSVNGSTPLEWIDRYEQEMADGKMPEALVTGMLGPEMGPPITKYIPRFILVWMAKRLLALEDKKGSGTYLSMRELLPTLHHDGQLLRAMAGTIDDFRNMHQNVLLLNGANSAKFQRASVAFLAATIPHTRHVELAGLNHGGAWNYDKKRNPHGNPARVAEQLVLFFKE